MLLNSSPVNAVPLNSEEAPFTRLLVAELLEQVDMLDVGRTITYELESTSLLTLVEQVLSDYIPGEAGPVVNSKIVSDLILAGDTAVLARLRGVIFSEGLSLLEALVRGLVRGRWLSDSLLMVDFTPLFRMRSLTSSEVVTVTESVVRQMNLSRALTEVIALIDQVTASKVKSPVLTETILLTDTGRLLNWDVTFEESLSVVDQIIKVTAGGAVVTRVTTDTFLVTDGVIRQVFRLRTLSDAILVEEAGYGKETQYTATVQETIELSDSVIANRLRRIFTTDGITLLDFLLNTSSSTRTVVVSEAFSILDQTQRSVMRNRFATDAILANESTAKALQRLMTLVEGIAVQDGEIRVRMWDSRIGESITLSDEFSRQLLQAVLYDVRIRLNVGPEPVLGAIDTAWLSSSDPVVLGAYN